MKKSLLRNIAGIFAAMNVVQGAQAQYFVLEERRRDPFYQRESDWRYGTNIIGKIERDLQEALKNPSTTVQDIKSILGDFIVEDFDADDARFLAEARNAVLTDPNAEITDEDVKAMMKFMVERDDKADNKILFGATTLSFSAVVLALVLILNKRRSQKLKNDETVEFVEMTP